MYLVAKALLSRGCVYIVAENLAFTMKDNTLDRVVLLDFGTVRATRDPFTSMGMTPQYMAPESCQGAFYDFKSEIWAVAASVIFLYLGEHPYPATWFTKQQLNREGVPSRSALCATPTSLVRLVRTALSSSKSGIFIARNIYK